VKDLDAQYAARAAGWSEEQYADPAGYLSHRARLIVSLGPALGSGDRVLDLACGDGGLAAHLGGLDYLGVDASAAMVAAAGRRGVAALEADLNDYEPPAPVAATTLFRALYYARDRRAFFRRVAGYTEKKLVFDLNPRQYRLRDVHDDLLAAGFAALTLRPFLVPQTRALPRSAQTVLVGLERTRLARLALRFRFTYVCAASTAAGSVEPAGASASEAASASAWASRGSRPASRPRSS
jgi:SAM-dependent methyltransferase